MSAARRRRDQRPVAAASPQAVAALLRYFRDLNSAEEAFQEACLRAASAWPWNGRLGMPVFQPAVSTKR
jgi:predicted RNA polymerase sigma factor